MTQETRSSKTSASLSQTHGLLPTVTNVHIHNAKHIKIHSDQKAELSSINRTAHTPVLLRGICIMMAF